MNDYTVQNTDKLYLITHKEIAPGYQAVQAAHALRQFTEVYPEKDFEWYCNSNYLGLLSVETQVDLLTLMFRAQDLGLKVTAFKEPDIGNEITAIVIEPHPLATELCKDIPLALKEYNLFWSPKGTIKKKLSDKKKKLLGLIAYLRET